MRKRYKNSNKLDTDKGPRDNIETQNVITQGAER